ncbi:nucleotide exchange factor GrpE [Candidatus Parcubacteria bacterium]|nr:nucleotide exchange factor GrpE [Candidatus Parcubacteria bacterium]
MPKENQEKTNEEIVYDESDTSEGANFDLSSKLKKVKKDLKKCQEEKQEYLNGWQRSKADFINFKKRSEESKKDIAKYASENIILEIIPIIDNFEQAFKNKQVWESVDENWRKGIEMIHAQLVNVLKRNGVTEIESLGKEFDPKIHESVEIVKVDDKKDNDKIIEVLQKGYKIDGKVIRHPNVKVGKFE